MYVCATTITSHHYDVLVEHSSCFGIVLLEKNVYGRCDVICHEDAIACCKVQQLTCNRVKLYMC